MEDVRTIITRQVAGTVAGGALRTTYRKPLVGFADADDPWFARLRTIIAADHLLPGDLLPGARSVVSFFLPFDEGLVRGNQPGPEPSLDWAVAKKETDGTIQAVIQGMRQHLAPLGIRCSDNPALERYDPGRFVHRWSQRHVGYICGLGTFGLNQLLITESGCAGRLGSFCIDRPVVPDAIQEAPACPYRIDGSCGVCVRQCPSGALGFEGIDKPACSAWINRATERRFDGDRAYRSCGKCIALPCALKRPRT